MATWALSAGVPTLAVCRGTQVVNVARGGTLLYCTCSFAPEENEAVVAHLLRRHPEASLQPVQPPAGLASQPGLTDWQGKAYPEALQHSVRILPDADVDGFYLARICKTG